MVVRIVLSFVAVIIRLCCKTSRQSRKSLPWDDIFIVLALISSTAGESVVFWGLSKGGSEKSLPGLTTDNQYEGVQDYLLSIFIGGITDYITTTFIRLSILFFYCNIFGAESKFRYASMSIAATSIVWNIVCVLAQIFMCTPVDHLWKPLSPGVCHNYMLFFLIVEIFETMMDASILALPIPSILALQLPLRTRLSVIGIFLLGAFVVITNILRIRFMYQPNTNYVDFHKATLWTSIHITSAILCACLPLCKPFWIKVVESTHFITQFTRSLLSTSQFSNRGDVSASQYGSQGAQNKRDASSAENLFQMEQYDSKSFFRLDPSEHVYKAEVHGQGKGQGGSEAQPPRVIKVQNEFEVV
jgi:hypothetical protein